MKAAKPRPRLRARSPALLAAAAGIGLAACAAPALPPAPPAPATPVPALPPIPAVDGPLELRVVYPPEGEGLTARDSTFVFGSTGTGAARVTINGFPVDVAPNGAFLAFLPVPPDGVYRVGAAARGDTAALERTVRVPPPPPAPPPAVALLLGESVYPAGALALPAGEPVEMGFRGAPGGTATLHLPDGSVVPLVERTPPAPGPPLAFEAEPAVRVAAPPAPLSWYRGSVPATPLASPDPETPSPTLGAIPPGAGHAFVRLVAHGDTQQAPLRLNLAALDPARPRAARAFQPEPYPRSEGRVRAAAGPGYTFHYFWPDGTELTLTGERGGEYRVRLAPGLHAWVPAAETRLLPGGAPPAAGRVGTVRLVPAADHVDVRIDLDRRLPFRVEPDGRFLDVLVYGGTGDTGWLRWGRSDPYVRDAVWSQPADGVYRLRIELAAPVWGYAAFFDAADDLIVRVRRPPPVDPARPLRGLVVAVDPGHPPGGAVGPTGLTEAEANLRIALRLRPLLEAAGARVVMTRTEHAPLGLYERTRIAEEAGAHLFVSVHNDAFPDGVNPFVNAGTSVFYFHPHSAALADALQRELAAELRIGELGVGRSSLAVVRRLEWMPAVLTESMFLMIPEQEAALRDPVVQERIARAHVRGLERFLREYGRP